MGKHTCKEASAKWPSCIPYIGVVMCSVAFVVRSSGKRLRLDMVVVIIIAFVPCLASVLFFYSMFKLCFCFGLRLFSSVFLFFFLPPPPPWFSSPGAK